MPQGTQTDDQYAASYASNGVTNVSATTQQTSCYTPEVPYFTNLGPNDGYSGMSSCPGATTGEALGPYPSQSGSNPGSPANTPMLVKEHSESDIRVDPTNPNHLIGSSKWVVSAEGYNHLLGFYESFDGGKSWLVQGHIPGYEGWTDNTDPVGAFDIHGNYYAFILPYQFFYNANGSHNFKIGTPQEPNPSVPAEEVSVAVRPHGAVGATDWITTHKGRSDVIASYDAIGNEPDKQWITIDDSATSPHTNRVYAMWVDFHHATPQPFVSYADANADGSHSDWSAPKKLPLAPNTPQGATYLLPHVTPNGDIYTTLTNFTPQTRSGLATITLDKSTDGGASWENVSTVATNIVSPPSHYANTTFRDGIENTMAVGSVAGANGKFPVYVAWEDYSAGVTNILMKASDDGGLNWSSPIQVNDNSSAVDEFQPNLAAASNGRVSVNFYDRRLACPQAGAEATAAGLPLDMSNPAYSGSLPPYGATNYCVNASVQFYDAALNPIGHNVRLSQHTWDGQLNSPRPAGAQSSLGFIGDYFGNTIAVNAAGVLTDYATSVSTFNDGTNPSNRQQQVVSTIAVP